MLKNSLDILVLINIAVTFLVLALSAIRNERLFRKIIAIACFFQIATGVLFILAVLKWVDLGSFLSNLGHKMAATNPMAGWLVAIVSFLLFTFAFIKILPSRHRSHFAFYSIHKMTCILTAVETFLVIPLVSAFVMIFQMDGDFGGAWKTASILAIGFGGLFVRLDLTRSLALSSFAHRNAVLDDLEALKPKAKKWNWYAFLFGVRWYFYKGLLRQGWIMMIPYLLLLIPGLSAILVLPVMFGTRIYCGLYGTRDYLKLKADSFF